MLEAKLENAEKCICTYVWCMYYNIPLFDLTDINNDLPLALLLHTYYNNLLHFWT